MPALLAASRLPPMARTVPPKIVVCRIDLRHDDDRRGVEEQERQAEHLARGRSPLKSSGSGAIGWPPVR